MKPQRKLLLRNEVATSASMKTLFEVATCISSHDMDLNWESQQEDLRLQLQESWRIRNEVAT